MHQTMGQKMHHSDKKRMHAVRFAVHAYGFSAAAFFPALYP
jgi:hypothetical protein